MASRGSGGSRYPSAYGHTPSYRSYNRMDSVGSGLGGSGYPSAMGATSSLTSADKIMADMKSDKFFSDTGLSSTFGSSLTPTGSGSSSSKKVSSSAYSSSYSSASDGGRPKVEYSSDATHRSQATGSSGIPHTSYSHTSAGYSSENPYKNRVNSYSYNV